MKFSTIKRKWSSLIGVPLPWPTATPPDGFIALTGQAINQATDPLLYARYGATAPDMRSEIIRGWDNGRGVDAGRVLLSAQLDQIQNITGTLAGVATNVQTAEQGTGAFMKNASSPNLNGGSPGVGTLFGGTFDASRVARAGTETRMRNVAWNYITMRG